MIGEEHGARSFTGNDHFLFANELEVVIYQTKPPPRDGFDGDNAALINSINALLELDATGALVPHGIGGSARQLLRAAASRLKEYT